MPYTNNVLEAEPPWAEAVTALADRVIGQGAGSRLQIHQRQAPDRSFTLSSAGGHIRIDATDAIAACVALHRYLRAGCEITVCWDTPTPLDLRTFPEHAAETVTARVPQTYYFNFCTFSYSTAFWSWPEWEREIDWMALHGITMPLAAVGHEAVLHTALQQFGLDDDDARTYLGGPGYLPFQYMGCLDSFGGPLSAEWITDHLQLGRDILGRERSLGMTPVLPAFTGAVPAQIESTHTHRRSWQGFETTVLTPASPLYRQLTATITETQRDLLGTDHLYAADPFIEMIPVEEDPGYPGRVATETLAGLTNADPQAVWVMQAWPFSYQRSFWTDDRVQRFLDAIDDTRIHLLDLWGEEKPQWDRFSGFSGKPWSWCALLNFGGRTDPVGNFAKLIDEFEQAIASQTPPAGLGLTMEGIHNNPMFFELATDLAWSRYEDVSSWLARAVPPRYGPHAGARAVDAWNDIAATVYARQDPVRPNEFAGVVARRPSYEMLDHTDAVSATLWFDPRRFSRGWENLLRLSESWPTDLPATLERDLTDITTTALLRLADHRFIRIARTAAEGHVEHTQLADFLQIFTDLDSLLMTRPESQWASWETQAARWDNNDRADTGVAVMDARRLLTTWQPRAGGSLDDYAARLWGGLVAGYYRARWAAWAEGLSCAVSDGRAAAADRLTQHLQQIADDFIADGAGAPPPPSGMSTSQTARDIYDRIGAEFAALPRPQPERTAW